MQGLDARRVALDILEDVLDRQRALDDALAQANDGKARKFDPRDRAFVRVLVTMTLRRLGEIDAVISQFLAKPLPKKAQRAKHILQLGAAQVLFLDVAAHAAVTTSVALSKQDNTSRPFSKLINAVMRRVSELTYELDAKEAASLNTPNWLLDSWTRAYGEDKAIAIAQAHCVTPPLDLSVRDDAAGWAERLSGTVLPNGSVRLPQATDVAKLDGFAEGAWWVQDAAATLPIRLLGISEGDRVLDLCAAPGGKTLQLAALGAQVTAIDRSAPRLKRVEENLKRVGLEAEILCADVAAYEPEALFPFILLDAPCSATGTIRRHPDVPFTKSPKDVVDVVAVQSRLLDAAFAMLAPGGQLVYCVCSLEQAEGEAQIEDFLARQPQGQFDAISVDESPDLKEFVSAAGTLRTLPCCWPERGGLDGFFAARLTKSK